MSGELRHGWWDWFPDMYDAIAYSVATDPREDDSALICKLELYDDPNYSDAWLTINIHPQAEC